MARGSSAMEPQYAGAPVPIEDWIGALPARVPGATVDPGAWTSAPIVTLRHVDHHIAQVNIGRLAAPADSEQLAGFFAQLEPVNAAADGAPGFVWRLQTEEGNATAIVAFEWDQGDSHGVLVNMSVWESIEQLAAFVYGDLHRAVLRGRRAWFQTVAEATTCLWWVPAGHRPSTDEAEERLMLLRQHGPTPAAFTFRQSFEPTDSHGVAEYRPGRPDWLCPA